MIGKVNDGVKLWAWWLSLAVFLVLQAHAQPRPENSSVPAPSPTGATAEPEVVPPTAAELSNFLEGYLQDVAPKGEVLIYDQPVHEQLRLRVDKIENEEVRSLDAHSYLVSTLCKGEGKASYAVDFVVWGETAEALAVDASRTSIRRVGSSERYRWVKDKFTGHWKKERAGRAAGEKPASEAPAEGAAAE